MNRNLWALDASGSVTTLLENFQLHRTFRQVGDLVFFSAFDQTDVSAAESRHELYATDGTIQGTERVQDLNPPTREETPPDSPTVGATNPLLT